MSLYLTKSDLQYLNDISKQIFSAREKAFQKHGVDVLDTDTLSSIAIYQIVSQYDSGYNINFSRNGEDASSNGVKIEQKACRINESLTKAGKVRKSAGRSGVFMFHAMGDLKHSRYIFVARRSSDLNIVRLYDISGEENCKKVLNELMRQRKEWLNRGRADNSKMKNDIITLSEKFILDNIKITSTMNISGTTVLRDI